jgi:uncharacterized protein YndB with AHSA1/START domain
MMMRLSQALKEGPVSFKIARSFELPRAELFAAWTEPEHLVEWMANREVEVRILTCQPRAGGLFHFQLRSQDGMEAFGAWRYLDVASGRRLIFTEHPSNVRGELLDPASQGGVILETRVTFTGFHGVETFLDIESSPVGNDVSQFTSFELRRSHLAKAWDATLGRLESHCATQRTARIGWS